MKLIQGILIAGVIIAGSILALNTLPQPKTVGGGVSFSGSGSSFNGTSGVADSFVVSGPFTSGGNIRSTSTTAIVVPLLSTDFDIENIIDVTLNTASSTLSFPATSTLTSFIPTAGQTRSIYIRNATTTAAVDLQITGGTGVIIKNETIYMGGTPLNSAGIILGDTDATNYARVDFIRKADTDIEALVTVFGD